MTELNKEQKNASLAEPGITLVIAGAGTGKTRTLVEKTKNLIQISMKPENILILTFTRKAADEIKERVIKEIGSSAEDLQTGTFHSFSFSLLKQNEDLFKKTFGYKTFPGVIDEAAKQRIMKDLIGTRAGRFFGIPADVVYDTLHRIHKIPPAFIKKLKETGLWLELENILDMYKKEKIYRNLIDFEEMISCAVLMCENNEDLRNKIRNRIQYILVDEFQDTSPSNLALLRIILQEENPNLFAVGDDWQSIYGFRDAEIDYLVNVKKYFPRAKVVRLAINYRSAREIVELSNRFIYKNRIRTRKRLVSASGPGGKIHYHRVNGFREESDLLRNVLQAEKKHGGSVAVLYRNNWQGDLLMNEFRGEIIDKRVHFMTMHSSKGLEFDTVIITGIADSIIPDSGSDLEEERRVLYVAMTRARLRLHFVMHSTNEGLLPRFGSEIDQVSRTIIRGLYRIIFASTRQFV